MYNILIMKFLFSSSLRQLVVASLT